MNAQRNTRPSAVPAFYQLRGLTFSPDKDPGSPAGLYDHFQKLADPVPEEVLGVEIVRRSLDARRKNRPRYVYTLIIEMGPLAQKAITRRLLVSGQPRPVKASLEQTEGIQCRVSPGNNDGSTAGPGKLSRRKGLLPVMVVGSGPAGLFAALQLSEAGVPVVVLERGDPVEERLKKVTSHRHGHALDPESNIQFGEGGAGTFSDGKLYSGTRDRRRDRVLNVMVSLGAPADILYEARPHVGTDRLQQVVLAFRRRLERTGCRFRFRSQVTGLKMDDQRRLRGLILNDVGEVSCTRAVFALGHSARDSFRMLDQAGVSVAFKPFAAGFRIEHPQELIDRAQYGIQGRTSGLPAAEYRAAVKSASGRGVYTFCMCPGGEVVSAASGPFQSVTNGMSLRAREGRWANSGIVTSISEEIIGGGRDAGELHGIRWQEEQEKKAFELAGADGCAPAQRVTSFLDGRIDGSLPESSFRPGLHPAALDSLYDPGIIRILREGLRLMDRRIHGFVSSEGLLIGVETRTSSAVRIPRNEKGEAEGMEGIHPAGEGAGYAGGIISSAVDGLKAAESILDALDCT